MSDELLYAIRNHMAQGEYYIRHVDHMTREGLHNKSDIAAELAHRDIRIAELKAEIVQTQNEHLKAINVSIGFRARAEAAEAAIKRAAELPRYDVIMCGFAQYGNDSDAIPVQVKRGRYVLFHELHTAMKGEQE